MNIVSVKHSTENQKTYWFEVPDDLIQRIRSGDKVICDTRRGQQRGVAVTDVWSGDGIESVAVQYGATLPLRKILGVVHTIPMNKIKISSCFKEATPRKEKLIARLNEWYEYGYFCTNVCTDQSGVLYDGYTAYLVAKMLGMKELKTRIMSLA